MKADVYQIVTERLIATLESGTAPWRKPWSRSGGIPRNAITGRPYHGINAFLLLCLPYSKARFLTYKQAQAAGGTVRKGEKGAPVVFWNWIESDKKASDGEAKKIPFLKYFTVFNIAQCEGLELDDETKPETAAHDPIPAAQGVIDRTGASVHHGGFRAFYEPGADRITMPEMSAFETPEAYYQTAFHELGHWTGHKSRLHREGITAFAAFGSAVYSREELIAEMTASFLCAKVGIYPDLENSASYLAGWIKALRGDSKLAVRAAGAASKAADFVLGEERGEA